MAQKKRKGKKGQSQLFVIFSCVTAAVFLPTTLLLLVGMAPTVVAIFVDRSRKKTKAITVGALNLAGCSPFMLELWSDGHSFDKSFAVISDPMAITVMFMAASVGYLVDWSMSGIVANVMYQRGLMRQKAIKKRQKQLVERWGEEVAGEIPLDEHGFPLEPAAKPIDKKNKKKE